MGEGFLPTTVLQPKSVLENGGLSAWPFHLDGRAGREKLLELLTKPP